MATTSILLEVPALQDPSVRRGTQTLDMPVGKLLEFPPQVIHDDPYLHNKLTQWVILSRAANGVIQVQTRSERVFRTMGSAEPRTMCEDSITAPEPMPLDAPFRIDTLQYYFAIQVLDWDDVMLEFLRIVAAK